jgi:hypothetical protein
LDDFGATLAYRAYVSACAKHSSAKTGNAAANASRGSSLRAVAVTAAAREDQRGKRRKTCGPKGMTHCGKSHLMNRLSFAPLFGKRGSRARISGYYSAEIVNLERVSKLNCRDIDDSALALICTILLFRQPVDVGGVE